MAKKSKNHSQAATDSGCPSSKLFNGKRERCVEAKGHPPPHRDIFNRTWK